MTKEEYEAVKAAICPYCAAKLSDTLYSLPNKNVFRHGIPRTDDTFECRASSFRANPPTSEGWITE